MKKHYLYILLLLVTFGCKKDDNKQIDTTTKTPPETMHIVINSDQLFSYNITEQDTVTNEFSVKDDYDKTSLDYYFTPTPGHKVTIEALTKSAGSLTATITYKNKPLGPIVSHPSGSATGFEFSYAIPH